MISKKKKIILEDISLEIPRYFHNSIFRIFSQRSECLKLLSNISLIVEEGERVAITGPNGYGKTTLLRLISGIVQPTSGTFKNPYRTLSLISLGDGVNEDLTGLQNIYLLYYVYHYGSKLNKQKVNKIIEFADIGDSINHPLRTYSSGMRLRLIFSIMTAEPAELLVFDEWLSVGDQSFQKRVNERINKMIKNSSALVFASHNRELVDKFSNKEYVFLEKGVMKNG